MQGTILNLLTLRIFLLANAFNFDVQDPIVKRGEKGTYFGYSVAEHITDSDVPWLLVGAPLARNLQPRTNHSGALFKCPLDKNECIQVETDGRRTPDFDYGENNYDPDSVRVLDPPGRDEIKDGQWLGVAVRSRGGVVMVCAHRYIMGENLSQTHHGLGLCYSLKTDLEWDNNWVPCKGRLMTSEHQQFGLCQAGTSLALLEDGTALIGSPGPFTWRGTMFVIKINGDFVSKDKTVYLGPLNNDPEPIDKYSYLGMSVAGGHFFEKNITAYASGAPRSQHHGQVYFFGKQINNSTMFITLIINGSQFASNFGYEILAVDVNNDGYDELFVAAPFYYNNTVGGAVYIYSNLRSCTMDSCNYDQMLIGPSESRFGFAMTSLGDINHDGYNDVAVGAPYEQSSGAVYIYLGGKDGLNPMHSQKITIPGFTTIGYSLSGGLDMDNNKYPDLLMGAYDSDMVVLFRTRAIIHIDISVEGDELKNIDSTKPGCEADPYNTRTCFSFNICIKLKRPERYNRLIYLKSFIEADIDKRKGKFARVKFNSTSDNPYKEEHFSLSQHVSSRRCRRETVYIKEANRDILSPIKFNVSYILTNNETLSPILNQTSIKEFVATFQKDCGSDDVCQSNLLLTAGLYLETGLETRDDDDNVYLLDLGSREEFRVNVNISNTGDSAYEAQLFLVHPISISYISLIDKQSDIKCTDFNDTLVMCNLGNPFQKEKTINLGLRFQISNNKMNKVKEIPFFVFVNSTSEELSRQTSAAFKVVVKKRAEVKITGAATSYIIFGGAVKGESAIEHFDEIGSRVWHTYQVSNEGPWTVDSVVVNISWPIQLASSRSQGKWLLYLEDIPKVEYDGRSHASCYIETPFLINELNFTNRPGGVDTPPDNFMMPPPNMNTPGPSFLRASNSRRRREASYIIPESCTDKKRNCSLDCATNTAKCAHIICKLPKLFKTNEATIQIKSRIWNSTLVEEFSKKDFIKIISRAVISISDENVEQDGTDDEAKAETTAYPETTSQEKSVPIWIYIVSILAGILFVLLISFILYKVGFFKRNRVKDPTLSGNLMKSGESEGLLNK